MSIQRNARLFNKSNFALLIVSIAFVESCTIQKRLYRNGYSVQWEYSTKELYKKTSDKRNSVEISRIPTSSNFITDTSYLTALRKNFAAPSFISYSASENSQREVNNFIVYGVDTPNIISDTLVVRKPHWSAKTSFITGLLTIVTLGTSGVFAIIFGIIALVGINKNPEKFDGNLMAITGIALGILGLLLFAIVISAIF